MSYHVFFSFSTGLSGPMRVPKGTLKRIWGRIEYTEQKLGLTRTPAYTPEGEPQRPGWHWQNPEGVMLNHAGPEPDRSLTDWWEIYRERKSRIGKMAHAVRLHNQDVIWLYGEMEEWSGKEWKDSEETEVITPEQSVEFWGGLVILDLPRELWDKEHFTDHMEHLHKLLSTRRSRGVSLDCEPLTPKQISELIVFLEGELDQWNYDLRFAVPLDENLEPYGFLAKSYDGGYDWCSHCGPIYSDDFHARCRVCPRAKTGECELKNEHPGEFDDEEE